MMSSCCRCLSPRRTSDITELVWYQSGDECGHTSGNMIHSLYVTVMSLLMGTDDWLMCQIDQFDLFRLRLYLKSLRTATCSGNTHCLTHRFHREPEQNQKKTRTEPEKKQSWAAQSYWSAEWGGLLLVSRVWGQLAIGQQSEVSLLLVSRVRRLVTGQQSELNFLLWVNELLTMFALLWLPSLQVALPAAGCVLLQPHRSAVGGRRGCGLSDGSLGPGLPVL